ncbi:MAG: 16S rRNA (guanine(527)-N(7))-methyltransferase RsmG [Holosporaceae bacterium]|nr:16S rRNA (guanine(527)-N(7))-methyltransferase RsmG [Holosporaceae bacterium]
MISEKVSRETYEKLKLYKDLLLKWQKAVNLVSRETLRDVWNRHILDSLQTASYISGKKVLDVGSGGGFPGMVLAITGKFSVTCVDSDRKKMLFLSEVARVTDTNVNIITSRIEDVKTGDFDTVCARGFSSLADLIEITSHFAGEGVFLKGARLQDEIEKAQSSFCFQYKIHQSETDDRGKIIVVDSIKRKVSRET